MRIEQPHEEQDVLDTDARLSHPLVGRAPSSGEWNERTSGVARTSARPSAFGPPRSPSRHGFSSLSSGELDIPSLSPPHAHHEDVAPSTAIATPITGTRTLAGAAAASDSLEPGPSVTTDIEALLPISQAIKSLPKPPRLPSFDEQPTASTARRVPWASLSVFGCALMASFVSIVHYIDPPHALHAVPMLPSAPAALDARVGTPAITKVLAPLTSAPAASPPVSSREHDLIAGIERAFAGRPEAIQGALYEEGARALGAGEDRIAESLFGRLFAYDADSAQGAFGLAKVRVAQKDFEGAEGWIRTAIDARPHEAAYRLLYADLLQHSGRIAEAEAERALVRSPATRTDKLPAH